MASESVITASMLSAYERGEHAITVRRLSLLAQLYDTSLERLAEGIDEDRPPLESEVGGTDPIRFELKKLQAARGREAQAARHLVQSVEQRRRRRNPDWIEVRHEDLATAAAILGRSVGSFVDALQRCDVLRRPQGRPVHA